MDDRRAEPRLRRLKPGRLIFNDRLSTMSCLVRDMSGAGARLTCDQPFVTAAPFELEIGGEANRRPARRMWVRGNEIGVRFMG